jgi:hypothetical protein
MSNDALREGERLWGRNIMAVEFSAEDSRDYVRCEIHCILVVAMEFKACGPD